MFRRRPPRRRPFLGRRPFRRPLLPDALTGRPLASKLRRILTRANQLMAEGQFTEAAAIYERLCVEGKERGFIIRAADFALQAARAYFAAGDIDAALAKAKEGLQLLARGGRPERIPRVLSKIVAKLREKGYNIQADELEREAERILSEVGLSLEEAEQQAPQMPERRGTLPAKCSGCGAPVIPDEVEWHDAQTAECLYCGTVLKAT
jgi:tetratricopeptide (TPR) repeat protein